MPAHHLIFDLDGTLIDSSDGVVAATNYALTQLGIPERPADEVKRFIGYPLRDMFTAFTDAPYDQLSQHFQVRARETVVGTTVALPYAGETLRLLRDQGYRMAIATTKIKVHIDLILDKCDWRDLFDATVGGDEVAEVKPAPDAFELALRRLDADRRNSIVIGDTINDVLAARTLQIPVIAIASPYGGNEELRGAGPTYHLSSLRDLPALLDRHFNGDES